MSVLRRLKVGDQVLLKTPTHDISCAVVAVRTSDVFNDRRLVDIAVPFYDIETTRYEDDADLSGPTVITLLEEAAHKDECADEKQDDKA